MRCPNCGSRSTGRIGQDQYYCWDCNVEFHVQGKGARIYSIDLEGIVTLQAVKSPNETEIRSVPGTTVSGYSGLQRPRDGNARGPSGGPARNQVLHAKGARRG